MVMISRAEIIFLLLAFLAGFAVLEIEILGTRLISPVYGLTIFVWTSLITTTMIGLAIGYWVGGILADKRRVGRRGLSLILLMIGIYILSLQHISRMILKGTLPYLSIVTGPIVVSVSIFLLPFIFLAMVIPVATKLLTTSVKEVGTKVGKVAAFETMGSLLGGLFTGYWLILYAGVSTTILVTGSLFLLVGILLSMRKKFLPLLLIPLFFSFTSTKLPASVIFRDAGYYSQITVTEEVFGKYEVRQLILDNAVQTILTNDPNYFNYINFFRIPFYLKKLRIVLMIGLGGGLGVTMLADEYEAEVDTVEIDPKVVKVAEEFFEFDLQRFKVIVNDGRNYLLTTEKKYDLIISDIAFVDWAPYLFTTNFYRLVDERLNEGGCFMINVIAEVEGNNFLSKSIYSDLQSVFDDVVIFRNPKYPLEEWDNTFFLACKTKIEIEKIEEKDFIQRIISRGLRYEELLEIKNKDEFIPIEKESLRMRQLYFDFAKDKIKKLI
jgi:spermidine synthase